MWLGEYKGIRTNMLRKNNKNPLKIALYNLNDDISESKDIAAENPEILAKVREIMTTQHTPSTQFPFKPLDEVE